MPTKKPTAAATPASKKPSSPPAAAATAQAASAQDVADEDIPDTVDGMPGAAVHKVKWARIVNTIKIPGPGGGAITMQKGKQVSTQSYDFEKLTNAGVELDACDPPAWWINMQKGNETLARQ